MSYYIFDDKVNYRTQDSHGCFPLGDGLTALIQADKDANVAVVDCDFKVIIAPEDNPELKDIEINRHFDQNYVVQDERIGRNQFQVAGIHKDKVCQVYNMFSANSVKALVPYGLTLRAFLNKNRIDTEGKCVVFVDDNKDGILITILDHLKVGKTRRISQSPPETIITEIKRTLQKLAHVYSQENTNDPEYIFVSNNQEIINQAVISGLVESDFALYVASESPAMDGMEHAKFNMHFLLPEQVLKERKLREVKGWLGYTAVSFILLIMGIAFYSYALVIKQSADRSLSNLETELIASHQDLLNKNRGTYQSQIKSGSIPPFSQVHYHFWVNVPEEYLVDHFEFKKNGEGEWIFESVLYLKDRNNQITPFGEYGVFKKRSIEHISIKNTSGQYVFLSLDS